MQRYKSCGCLDEFNSLVIYRRYIKGSGLCWIKLYALVCTILSPLFSSGSSASINDLSIEYPFGDPHRSIIYFAKIFALFANSHVR